MHFISLSSFLAKGPTWLLAIWSATGAFITYFSMYAFRKPFTVAKYENLELLWMDYKVILLFSQVGGYALSKFIGIKVISEMTPNRRAISIIGLVAVAHVALLPYAFAPLWLKPIFLFINGLPLGMVFGCVFAFLEGRRTTEFLAAGLCASFIMASGVVKSVGLDLMTSYDVSQFWMPFTTGLLFWLPLALGVWMLVQIPPPDEKDLEARTERVPIDSHDRWTFFQRNAFGIIILVGIYVLLTIFRSIRDDYAAEIWAGFGFEKPAIFATSETYVAIVTVSICALITAIRPNLPAFLIGLFTVFVGFAFAMGTTVTYWNQTTWTETSALLFMVLIGIGLYVPYMLFHTTIYERLIAFLRTKANIGYLLYLADFAGYVTTIIMLILFKALSSDRIDFVGLLFWLAILISPISMVGCCAVAIYFIKKGRLHDERENSPDASMHP